MKLVNLDTIGPPGSGSGRFEGYQHGANVSFFVVRVPPGRGANLHRHPYEESLIVLDGEVEFVVGEETQVVPAGNIAIVPPNTWHKFTNISESEARMVNIHPVAQMVQENRED